MKTRTVVTGVGVITPTGNNAESFWQGLKDKTAGIGPITCFDTTGYKRKLVAEAEGFDLKQYMGAKAARRMETLSQLAAATSKKALEQSDIDMEKEDPYRVGVCVGSGIDPLQATEKDVKKPNNRGPSRVSSPLVPLMISSMAADSIAIRFGFKGKRFNVVAAYAAGTRSIGKAFRSIQYDEADVMVTGGAETSITPIGIAGLTSPIALGTTEDVSRASIPFGEDRNGFVMDEGVGMVVLESLKHTKVRGANVLIEVVGYGTTRDAFHITSPVGDRGGATRAVENAAEDAGITAEDTDYVNVHGTSTHHSDLFGTKAIKLALGDYAQKVRINSTKSMIGHLLGAVGSVEFITRVESVQDGFVHAIAGFKKPGEGYDLDCITGDGVSMNMDMAIGNSPGFGGHNAGLIIKKSSE